VGRDNQHLHGEAVVAPIKTRAAGK
jgi:hypothetical protein